MSRITLIAGEASGDQLGGWLMASLRDTVAPIEFAGIGGQHMQAQGLRSLFPMQDISLMGFAEIIPHLFMLKKRIRQTIEAIEAHPPDILITIDSPGFTFRVVQALKARGRLSCKFVHYVAPTVWAYKPERAEKTARLFDGLMVLLPFEPPYFEKHGLRTCFTGHPMAWWWLEKGDGHACRNHHGVAHSAPLLALFPGSRNGEIKRHMPLFRDTVATLMARHPALETILLVRPENRPTLDAHAKNWPCPMHLVMDVGQKKNLCAASQAALAKSGTIGLECALAGLPGITVYRANPISAWYIRRKLRTPFVNLANILCRAEVIPEFLQEAATPKALADTLSPILSGDVMQSKKLSIVPAMLGANEATSPSDKAAQFVASFL